MAAAGEPATFGREVVAGLTRLASEGLIRVLDVLVIQKAADGSVEGFERDGLGGDDFVSPLALEEATRRRSAASGRSAHRDRPNPGPGNRSLGRGHRPR
jgi:hypothetical protein